MKVLEDLDEMKTALELKASSDPAYSSHLKEVEKSIDTVTSGSDSVKGKLMVFLIEAEKFGADNSKDFLQLQAVQHLLDEADFLNAYFLEIDPHILWTLISMQSSLSFHACACIPGRC